MGEMGVNVGVGVGGYEWACQVRDGMDWYELVRTVWKGTLKIVGEGESSREDGKALVCVWWLGWIRLGLGLLGCDGG